MRFLNKRGLHANLFLNQLAPPPLFKILRPEKYIFIPCVGFYTCNVNPYWEQFLLALTYNPTKPNLTWNEHYIFVFSMDAICGKTLEIEPLSAPYQIGEAYYAPASISAPITDKEIIYFSLVNNKTQNLIF